MLFVLSMMVAGIALGIAGGIAVGYSVGVDEGGRRVRAFYDEAPRPLPVDRHNGLAVVRGRRA